MATEDVMATIDPTEPSASEAQPVASTSCCSTDVQTDGQTSDTSAEDAVRLSAAQKARIERNRQKALLLRQSRIASQPYTLEKPDKEKGKLKAQSKVIDTGGGFLLEEEEEEQCSSRVPIVHPKGAVLGPADLLCEECDKEFLESYLHDKFEALVCDQCRDKEEKHRLVTKTDAKNRYLLKDVDFDVREPALKYIVKKNPRNPHWGDMKLFLESQIADRALEVWGSEEKLEEAMELRNVNKEKSKQKRFDKKVKELRMAVRSSLYRKEAETHEHEFGPETYSEEEDTYSKTCQTCGHTMSYEKM